MDHIKDNLQASETLKVVFSYMAEISSLRDYDSIIVALARMGSALTSADRCSVWVVNEERTRIWTKVAQGIEGIELPIDSGIVGDAILHGKKELINDVYGDARFLTEVDKKTGYKTQSMMVVPMYDYDNNIIGAFQVINKKSPSKKFEPEDIERLTLASTYAAETIIAASLSNEIEATQREVVFTMGSIAESRSKETGNHVKRVASYSYILALAYGLDKNEAELLKQASPMHDIGKVAIADSILNKPGRFDAREREIMNTHATLGYQMIKNSKRPLLKMAAIVAYQHHEKYDGTGYPQGLVGEDIHIYGRITALADVFDALGSDRVYKKAWPDEKIFQLIQDERGKHFDPKLVDLFFEHKEEILQIRETFQDRYEFDAQEDAQLNYHVKILGAYGTRVKGFGTTAILLNRYNLMDAGNILDNLGVESIEVENLWLSHSHLDHISDLAYMLDNYYEKREKTLHIRALPQTIEVLKKNYLNNTIWPDFSKIELANKKGYVVAYHPIEIATQYSISANESIEPIATDHTIKSCGFIYKKENHGIIITADTYNIENILQRIDNDEEIKSLIVECSFPNRLQNLAKESKHLTPKLLFQALEQLKREDIHLYIHHIKPMYLNEIIGEIEENRGKWDPILLKDEEFAYFF